MSHSERLSCLVLGRKFDLKLKKSFSQNFSTDLARSDEVVVWTYGWLCMFSVHLVWLPDFFGSFSLCFSWSNHLLPVTFLPWGLAELVSPECVSSESCETTSSTTEKHCCTAVCICVSSGIFTSFSVLLSPVCIWPDLYHSRPVPVQHLHGIGHIEEVKLHVNRGRWILPGLECLCAILQNYFLEGTKSSGLPLSVK